MKRKWTIITTTLGIVVASGAVLCLLGRNLWASQGTPTPLIANYYSAQNPDWPALPFVPFEGLAVYYLSNNAAMYDDLLINYVRLEQEATLVLALESALEGPPVPGEGGEEGPPAESPQAYDYPSNVLWIEITGVTNSYAYLTLHGTVADRQYQLLSQTNLNPSADWVPGEIITGTAGTNQTDFSAVFVGDTSNMFFRAHHAANSVYIYPGPNAYESNAVFSTGVGSFTINTSGDADLTVHYRISGTASNGVDYTNLTTAVTIPANSTTTIYVHPYGDTLVEGDETVILTLVQTNHYLILPTASAATNLIKDFSTLVQVNPGSPEVAIELDGPPGAAAQAGTFHFHRDDDQPLYPPLTVAYSIAGSAGNGTDYSTLSGTVTFPDGVQDVYLDVNPVGDTLVETAETVILTLVPTNTCAIDTNSATVTVADSSTTVEVTPGGDATEPHPASNISKQTGKFVINRSDTRGGSPALTVSYQLSGTATNGTDYTNLTGTVTIPAGLPDVSVFIEPQFDDQLEGDEAVILTLTHVADGYIISPEFAAATNTIRDNMSSNLLLKVVNLSNPAGIDYHQPSNSLIVACSFNGGNFARLYTNALTTNVVVTNWSGVSGVGDEVKLLTIKQTAHGFTNGEVFFSSGTGIGWISANGAVSNKNWCVLTNAFETNALPIRGGLCLDETGGVFSNELVVVTSPGTATSGVKGVWRVRHNGTNGIPTLITNISTSHLEGIITLMNDVTKWGPWAGKIVTGNENDGTIYAIDGNGVATAYDSTSFIPNGIRTEDFDLVRPDQDLYMCDQTFPTAIYKVCHDYLTNFMGDLMITEEGESSGVGTLYFMRWSSAVTNFTVRAIPFIHPNGTVGKFEHVTFAPISLPTLNP